MKKIILALLVVVSLVSVLTACGKFTCDLCKQEKSGKQYKEELFGEEIVYCKDCHENLEALGELAD